MILKKWQDVDIRDLKNSDLAQIEDIVIDINDTATKKLTESINQMGNPYFIADKKGIIKFSYATGESTSINKCISSLVNTI